MDDDRTGGMKDSRPFKTPCALLCAGLCLLPASCASRASAPRDAESGGGKADMPAGGQTSRRGEYTTDTLIISLAEGVGDDEVHALAARYRMEVIYLYKNFNMCAVRLPEKLSGRQFDELVARLEGEREVVSAMRDGIMHLD